MDSQFLGLGRAFWFLWAGLLLLQNFSFTFVSRARNSGSLRRHMVAAFFSNFVFLACQLFLINKAMDVLIGKRGWWAALVMDIFYTIFTMSGSLLAHWYALKFEKGAAAVGANKKYAQIPIEQWDALNASVADLLKRLPA